MNTSINMNTLSITYYQQQQQQQQQQQYHNTAVQCSYPSKRCENPRAAKRNGELHRFCEHHRVVANRNQQRLQQRRRTQKSQMPDLAAMQQMYSKYTTQQQQQGQYYPQCADTLLDLSEEDLRMLEAMLLDNEDVVFTQDGCLFDSPQRASARRAP